MTELPKRDLTETNARFQRAVHRLPPGASLTFRNWDHDRRITVSHASETDPMITSPLLDHCKESTAREASLSPDWFVREQVTVWARNWGTPVQLARDAAGTVIAFHNLCRQRGAELCPGEHQIGRRITCRYHARASATDGLLVSVPHARPIQDFLHKKKGLLPVPHMIPNGSVVANLPVQGALSLAVGRDCLDNGPIDRLATGHRRGGGGQVCHAGAAAGWHRGRDEPARPRLSRLHPSGRLMPQEYEIHRFHQWVLTQVLAQMEDL